MSAMHTPTPWPDVQYANDVGPNDEGFWEWYEIPFIGKFENEDDAKHALRCVNAHDDLVAALRAWQHFSTCCLHESTFAAPAFKAAQELTRPAMAKAAV